MSDTVVREARIARWGNSAAIRIGSAALERAQLKLDDPVEIIAGDNEITIRRKRPTVSMAELLGRFDPAQHRHDLAFDGPPTGTETR